MVLYVRLLLFGLHRDHFQQDVANSVAPDRVGALQAETFQMAQPFAFYGAIFPAIGKQFEALAIMLASSSAASIGAALAEPGRRDEQAVVAAR